MFHCSMRMISVWTYSYGVVSMRSPSDCFLVGGHICEKVNKYMY